MAKINLKPGREFSVGKIVAVGQNYQDHITEMKSERPESPVLFLKPATSILNPGQQIILPDYSNDVHHELELALLVGQTARSISADNWADYIAGVGIALDLTLRDLQGAAKKKGLPWSVAKGFDGACPLSDFVPLDEAGDIQNLQMELQVNDQVRQKGSTSQMIFTIPELLSHISKIFTLEPGDIVLTGTPAGVSALNHGDRINASISGVGQISFTVK